MRKFLGFYWIINYLDGYIEVIDKVVIVFIFFVFVDVDVCCYEFGGRCYIIGFFCDGWYKIGFCGG